MNKCEVIKNFYTPSILRASPNKIFVYGDNMQRKGKGGQAIIRDEINAYGIVTKRKPSMDKDAFFSDQDDETSLLINDVNRLIEIASFTTSPIIVFPNNGLGSGLARMKDKSPKLYEILCRLLQENFGFDNYR